MSVIRILHSTQYQYRTAVQLGEHRLMIRLRESHDLRMLDSSLLIEPGSSRVRWIHDVFGNSIAIVSFDTWAERLTFTSEVRAEHFPAAEQEITIEPYASSFPFSYSSSDADDLGRTRDRHCPDPEHRVDDWARAVLEQVPEGRTLDTLTVMTATIKQSFSYAAREAAGVQSPLETLERHSGSCRDFALLMMEAARSLGLAARFVSGYLYDDRRIAVGDTLLGGGATHAWVQIYLPGAGWVEYDPTNALVGGRNLIRVAVTRDPSQAIPVSGHFKGASDAYLSMSVQVEITAD